MIHSDREKKKLPRPLHMVLEEIKCVSLEPVLTNRILAALERALEIIGERIQHALVTPEEKQRKRMAVEFEISAILEGYPEEEKT